MKSTRITTILLLATVELLLPVFANTVDVRITGFTNDIGQARIVVMAGQSGHSRQSGVERVVTVPISAREAHWQSDDLAPGQYALLAHHDSNANNELDRPLLSLPLEPYGYSNGAWTSLGLPEWSAVAFDVDEETTDQIIELRTNAFVAVGQMLLVGMPSLGVILIILALVRYRRLQTERRNGVI